MSYIIAYVKFSGTALDYPVECYRTDLKVDENVLVRLADGGLKQAVVTRVIFLNWDCKSRIECKESEATSDSEGNLLPPRGSPVTKGLATPKAAGEALRKQGWIPIAPFSYYNLVFTRSNDSQTANILFRKNGVDFQILSSIPEVEPKPFSPFLHELTDGRIVRHYLSQTTFNLYEGVLRFSESFHRNENEYERFFKPVGSKEKRTADLAARLPPDRNRDSTRNGLSDIYDACSGASEGDAYMGDEMWISSGGRVYDGER
ncbi:hypothetical protein ACXU4B_04605 [Dyella soli]|uniref:Uncharacterized protein n=1 Tax=Dyella soli TaxID=522319 RepID=A0A4R0YTZ1_9GAMM|nr:hypothetical protein [Dyella soli]TCI10298.1 hypothetical protein EZM97_15490 [Dyella soli]